MEVAGQETKPHALMIPLPLQGHITPFVNLAVKLASVGFTVTFVNTNWAHHQIRRARAHASPAAVENGLDDDIFSEVRETGLDIRYMTVSDGLPAGLDRTLDRDKYLRSLLDSVSSPVDELVGDFVRSGFPVKCLIVDPFYLWPSAICRKHNLVHITFWTQSLLVLTMFYHFHLLLQNGHFEANRNSKNTIDYLPGVGTLKPTDMPSYLRDASMEHHQVIFNTANDMKNADIIICNSVQELEDKILQPLDQETSIYAVGPIFPSSFTINPVPVSLLPEIDITQWLDTRCKASVLFISFGSLAHMTRTDITEIAHGLLLSEFDFVWVLRPDIVGDKESDLLPVGFQDRVKDQGLVVSWCCQSTVVSHPAIGGFLTHCGWNSILESVWSGVPLLCFPLRDDQLTNRKLVVDDWRVGMNLFDEEKSNITRYLVAEKIDQLMGNGETRHELMKEMNRVRKTFEKALASDGSSQKNFKQLIVDVKAKILQKENNYFVTKDD